jgi:hypothetical protein
MTLSKQYYKAIGYVLAKNGAGEKMIAEFIQLFAEDNPRFDSDRFKTFIEKQKNESNSE